ncbi:MAG: HAMP domain-containing sensor histidine kinase [Burkholderiaceae bacterium]|nr:HAMP domain-containing sensor histidine kinase [Burkholderiaceae bacterium]MDP3136737.1 HAMP domain-containing sensor histidine kinase [Burkholderiaceae bacterium]
MTSSQKFQTELFAPLESIKDSSILKVRGIAVALLVGHLLYYWAWTDIYPQPYESLSWRLFGTACGALALFTSIMYGVDDKRTTWAYGVATAYGSVFLGSWFYVANGGNTVWLASLSVLIMLYFTLTDWRVALTGTLLSMLFAWLVVPRVGVGVWSSGGSGHVFDGTAWLILGFSIGTSLMTRLSDVSVKAVQLRSQLRALGITAHEIRTPLAALQLHAAALADKIHEMEGSGAVTAKDIGVIKRMASDVLTGVDDANALITTHLANANPFKPFSQRSSVTMSSAVLEAVELFQRGSGARQPLVTVEIPNDFEVDADIGVLKQVLLNLLNNSLKAVVLKYQMAAPGQITVRVAVQSGMGVLSVIDRGAGIRKADLPNIFKPFHTGDPDHGHGLGLTYVESAARAYSAVLDVVSNEGAGTTFTLTFKHVRTL